jgi:hypothetical protein
LFHAAVAYLTAQVHPAWHPSLQQRLVRQELFQSKALLKIIGPTATPWCTIDVCSHVTVALFSNGIMQTGLFP